MSKNLPVSDELHGVLKKLARQQGRMLQAVVAEAFFSFLGDKFPECREAELLPDLNQKEK